MDDSVKKRYTRPIGRICLRPLEAQDYGIEYFYPIYMSRTAPCHETYDSQGTIVLPGVGNITLDYRGVEFFNAKDYERLFSPFVLATNFQVRGPGDLRLVEFPIFDGGPAVLKIEVGRNLLQAKPKLKPHEILAENLGLEPRWFERVKSAWDLAESRGEDPRDSDEVLDTVNDLLDLQESEDEEEDDVVFPPCSEIETAPSLIEDDANSSIGSTTDVETIAGEAPASPIQHGIGSVPENEGLKVEHELAPNLSGDGMGKPQQLVVEPEAKKAPDILGSAAPGEPDDKSGGPGLEPLVTMFAREHGNKPKGLFNRELKSLGPTLEVGKPGSRNPGKIERRKSFEMAASTLAAIPRTKSGRETLTPSSTSRPTRKYG